MSTYQGGPRPNSRRNLIRPRQLTIGECIAIARYHDGLREEDEKTVPMTWLLDFIDHMQVCTTCGWPVHVHRASEEHKRLVHCCAQHTREF